MRTMFPQSSYNMPHHEENLTRENKNNRSNMYCAAGADEGSNFLPLIALVGELRLAHQKLPPGKRLQLRPITAIGKLRPPRQYPRPGKAAELIPTGKPLRHLRLGNDQPFPIPRIILRRQIIFTLVSNASSQQRISHSRAGRTSIVISPSFIVSLL